MGWGSTLKKKTWEKNETWPVNGLISTFFPLLLFCFVTDSLRMPPSPNMPCCCEVGKLARLSKNPAHFYWYFIDVPDLLRRPPPSNYAPKAKPLYSNFSLEIFCTSEFIGGLSILVGLFSPKEEVVGNFAANKIVGQNKMRAIMIIHNEGTVLSHFLCPLAPI